VIIYVVPNIAWNWGSECNTQLFPWLWPGNDALLEQIVTSTIDMTILSIFNATKAGVTDLSLKIWDLWGCRKERNADCSLHAYNVTPILNNHSAAICSGVAMGLINQILLCIAYRGQQADITSGAHTLMCDGSSHLPLDDIFPHPAKGMIDDISEELVDDAEMWCLKSKCF